MSFILSSINNNTVETTYNAEDIHVKINEHNSMNDEPIETDDVANELSPTDDEANELRQTDDEKNNLDPTDDETNELSQTDDETNDPSPTVDETNEHTEIDDDIILIEDKNQNSNKENITVTSEQTKNHTSNIFEKRCAEKVQNKNINNKASERYLNNYEESFNATTHVNILPEDTVKRKIEELEKRIKSYHELIEQLEQKEVDWDSTYNSPYLQSELLVTTSTNLHYLILT